MPVQTANELKAVLFDAYDGFADKRLKNVARDAPFIVDDRTQNDYDAGTQLYLWFCQMFVTVEAPDRVRLTFRGGTPASAEVSEWFERHGARTTNFGTEVDLTPNNLESLGDLIGRFSAITKRPYDTPAYKYVVPRVCQSLSQLQKVLGGAWA